jgi:hypothetical protein
MFFKNNYKNNYFRKKLDRKLKIHTKLKEVIFTLMFQNYTNFENY